MMLNSLSIKVLRNLMTTFSTSREIAASVEDVFAAFSQADRLARWWGPAGFTNSFDVFEFQPGGRWVFVMHGPDGANYPNENVFLDIQPAKKLILRHVVPPFFQLTVGFETTAHGTLVSWAQAFDDPEVARQVERIVVPSNEQNLDRLTAEVTQGKGLR
jgi:uncharacterized protein YndB with AHSA1/START domain